MVDGSNSVKGLSLRIYLIIGAFIVENIKLYWRLPTRILYQSISLVHFVVREGMQIPMCEPGPVMIFIFGISKRTITLPDHPYIIDRPFEQLALEGTLDIKIAVVFQIKSTLRSRSI